MDFASSSRPGTQWHAKPRSAAAKSSTQCAHHFLFKVVSRSQSLEMVEAYNQSLRFCRTRGQKEFPSQYFE
jgi:hypothetical protein